MEATSVSCIINQPNQQLSAMHVQWLSHFRYACYVTAFFSFYECQIFLLNVNHHFPICILIPFWVLGFQFLFPCMVATSHLTSESHRHKHKRKPHHQHRHGYHHHEQHRHDHHQLGRQAPPPAVNQLPYQARPQGGAIYSQDPSMQVLYGCYSMQPCTVEPV